VSWDVREAYPCESTFEFWTACHVGVHGGTGVPALHGSNDLLDTDVHVMGVVCLLPIGDNGGELIVAQDVDARRIQTLWPRSVGIRFAKGIGQKTTTSSLLFVGPKPDPTRSTLVPSVNGAVLGKTEFSSTPPSKGRAS